jgi:hypothetical protein
MDVVDRYAALKDLIRTLEDEAASLREKFLRPGAHLRSNRFEVTVRQHTRRAFQRDLLPSRILNDPKYWAEATIAVVSVRPLGQTGTTDQAAADRAMASLEG